MIETRALYNSGFLAATFLAQVCTMSAVSDGIDGDGGDCSMDGDCNDRPAPRKRRRAHGGGGKRPQDLESTLVLVFLIASTASCSRQLGSAKPHPHWLEMWSGAESLAGAALCRWKYHPRSDWREVEPAGQEMCLAAQRAVIGDIVGWVNHYVSGPVAMCEQWVPIDSADLLALKRHASDTQWSHWSHTEPPSDATTFDNLVQYWTAQTAVQGLQISRVFLHPSLCLSILELFDVAVHSVALPRNRAPLQRRCLFGSPPKSVLRALSLQCANAGESKLGSTRVRKMNELSAEENLEFLEASMTCTSLRKMPAAAKIWAKIHQRKNPEVIVEAVAPAYERLRRARIRFDMVAMLCWRYYFDVLIETSQTWFLYLFMDASPQWRGRDLFAVTFDLVVVCEGSRKYTRVLMPIINLGANYKTVIGKAWGFLWVLQLMIGPRYDRLKETLGRVISITTDLGTEFGIRDLSDCLHDFMISIGASVPRALKPSRWLFPLGLSCPGWHHIWDGLLRYCLCRLKWFGGFLDVVKALANWLRNHNDSVVERLQSAGLHAAAALCQHVKMQNFAQWRWKTLASVLKSVESCVFACRQHKECFFPDLDRAKDRVWASRVRRGLVHVEFGKQFAFVLWVTEWIVGLEKWGSRCVCEEHEGLFRVECNKKGRSIHRAWPHAVAVLDQVLVDVKEWVPQKFDLDIEFQQYAESAVRATVSRALQKIWYLDKVPYLLARLDEGREIAQRCLWQFDQVPPDKHHRVTLARLGYDSEYRQDVLILAAGGPISPPLLEQVRVLQDIPLDDSICEKPHASGRRFELKARGALFGWHAASQRLSQNLNDVDEIVPKIGVSLQYLWDNYAVVANARRQRARKLNHKAMQRHIYHLRGMPEVGRSDIALPTDDVCIGDGSEGLGHKREIVPKKKKLAAHSDEALFREWLLAAVKPGMYVSVHSGDDGGLALYQILDQPVRVITVESFDYLKESSQYWTLQRFELWLGCPLGDEPSELEGFVVESPIREDLVTIIGGNYMCREKCRKWELALSDVYGWQKAFTKPARLSADVHLSSAIVPVLSLLDQVLTDGFIGVGRRCEHRPEGLKVFNNRTPSRYYLQCIVASNWLWAQGCKFFMSHGAKAYYQLLLRDPSAPVNDMSTAQCVERLKTLGSSNTEVEALAVLPPAREVGVLAAEDAIDGDDGEAMLIEDGGGATAIEDEVPIDRPESRSPSVDGDDGEDLFKWPEYVCGVKLHHEDRVTPRGDWTEGLRVTCPIHGAVCRKFRSKHLRTMQDGRLAAVFYLGGWLKGSEGRTAAQHHKWNPSVADVHAFMLSEDCL